MELLDLILRRRSGVWTILGTAASALLLAMVGMTGCDIPLKELQSASENYYDLNPNANPNGGHSNPSQPNQPQYSSPGWSTDSYGQPGVGQQAGEPTAPYPPGEPTVVIGTFNIQSLGNSKMSKPDVVPILVDIIKRFDVLAVQELRDKDQEVIPDLLKLINRDGSAYAASVGPRQGYIVGNGNAYYEQSVFLYDTRRIEQVGPSFVAADPHREMHRAPYVARFRSTLVPPQQAFTFTLMNAHVDYDDALDEFASMMRIVPGVFPMHPDEDDFILLGDLNESPSAFQRFRWMDNQMPAIPEGWYTNTAQSKTYDNIVFDAYRTAEFKRQSGVLNMMAEYGISQEQARRVSDHMPVWAVFSAYESQPASLVRGHQVIR